MSATLTLYIHVTHVTMCLSQGDHPPITPVRSASEAEIGGGDAWRVYDYIARHFLG